MTYAPKEVVTMEGEIVMSDSEAWRHDCEVRAVINMSSKEQRLEYVRKIYRIRGDLASKRLYDDVLKHFEQQRKAQSQVAKNGGSA